MIAFCLWAEGFSDPKKLKEMREYPPGRFEIVAGEYKVDRCRISDYFSQDFWNNLNIWDVTSSYGLPHGGGWASHPTVLVQMLQVFDAAKAKIEKQKADEYGNSGRTQGNSYRANGRRH